MQQDKTLGDYIARKSDEPVKKKMGFEAWYSQHRVAAPVTTEEVAKYLMQKAWIAGQENTQTLEKVSFRCSWKTKEDLEEVVNRIPLNQPVTLIVGRHGWTRRLPVGTISRPTWHGRYAVSFYWTDGKYMEYVWITDSKDMDSIVEVIKENK